LHRVDARLAIFAVVGAFAIVSAVLPRVDRFPDPGPRLLASEQPRLFQTLSGIAQAAEQAMPRDVFLVADLNAWVAQRGGLMGIGSHRVMGLGLPLLETLNVAELRAVLAHEFGHYHGGDTALGPWIYETRAAIERTVANLSDRHAWLRAPFVWYGNGFLRITQKVSRHQEIAADALAAKVAGASALASGLRKIHASAPAFTAFVTTDLGPALDAGFRPSISEGFRRFLEHAGASGELDRILEAQLVAGPVNPYDSHPPLQERLAVLPADSGPTAQTTESALTLLDNHDGLERSLLATMMPSGKVERLLAVSWDELGTVFWMPWWRSVVGNNTARLAGLTPAMFAEYAGRPGKLAVRFQLAAHEEVASDRHKGEVAFLVGTAMAVLLDCHGWTVSALPGDEVVFRKSAMELQPFVQANQLFAGALSGDAWTAIWARAGLLDEDLGKMASSCATGEQMILSEGGRNDAQD
jgi:Zn-dependent protease with chaperone function